MLLHRLRERQQYHSSLRPLDIHGTVSPLGILAIDGPAALSSTGTCEDDEDRSGILLSLSWAQTSLEGIGRMRLAVGFHHLIMVEMSLQEGLTTLWLPTLSLPPCSPSHPGLCSVWLMWSWSWSHLHSSWLVWTWSCLQGHL